MTRRSASAVQTECEAHRYDPFRGFCRPHYELRNSFISWRYRK